MVYTILFNLKKKYDDFIIFNNCYLCLDALIRVKNMPRDAGAIARIFRILVSFIQLFIINGEEKTFFLLRFV